MKHRISIVAMASLCVYAILVNIGVLLNPDTPILNDSPAFLRVVELLSGKYAGHVVPFRIQYPIYPYLTWGFGFVTKEILFAARLASFVPTVITPLLVYLSCRLIGCGQRAALIGGLLLASAPPLIQLSGVPLYDSLFVCMTAASLASSLAAIQNPSIPMFAGAGAVCGLAAATRGPGLFFVFALVFPMVLMKDLSRAEKLARTALCLVVATGCLVVVRYPVQRLSAGLTNTEEVCTKQLIQDGIFFSNGFELREQMVYGLNEAGTLMNSTTASVCVMGWPEFLRLYGRDWIKMAFRNWKRIFFDLPSVLYPFAMLFFPVSLGLYVMLREKVKPVYLNIVLMATPFLLIVPMIQWQDRYFYPLFVISSVIAGLGVQFASDSLHRIGRILAVSLAIVACGIAAGSARHGMAPNAMWRNYREACEWIVASPKLGPNTTVMAREHGVYAFLQRETVPMPIASLDRTIYFARANGVDAIIVGPTERAHNPNIEGPTEEVESAKVFGEGDSRVEVLALTKSQEQVTR